MVGGRDDDSSGALSERWAMAVVGWWQVAVVVVATVAWRRQLACVRDHARLDVCLHACVAACVPVCMCVNELAPVTEW